MTTIVYEYDGNETRYDTLEDFVKAFNRGYIDDMGYIRVVRFVSRVVDE